MEPKKLEELLVDVDPLYREKVKSLTTRLYDKSRQLGSKSREYWETVKGMIKKNEVLSKLAKEISQYKGENRLNPFYREEIEKRRQELMRERDAYSRKIPRLKGEVKALTDDVRKINTELQRYLPNRAKETAKKVAIPLILIVVILSIAYLAFSKFQSPTGYSFLTSFDLTNSLLGIIFVIIAIVASLKLLK